MDAGDSREEGRATITLLVKTPNQVREDFVVDGVHLDWTVRELKARLTTVYPTGPAVSEQRLIYAGKLLPDHLHVKDIFRQTDSVQTLHLVYDGDGAATPLRFQTHGCSLRFTRSQRLQHTPDSEFTRAEAEETDVCRRHRCSRMASCCCCSTLVCPDSHAALAAAGSVPSAPASVAAGPCPPVPAHQVPVPAPLANQNPIDNLPANQNPAQDGAFINPGEANQNMRMNAQGGPVMEDEEAVERDWLDWLYSAARFCVLLVIVYFNSNLSRFLMVMSTLLLMYLHTAGWFPFRRRQVQGPELPQPAGVQQNQNRIPDPDPAVELADGQRDEAAAAAAAVDGPDGPMTAVLVPPHRVSAVWTAWVFFKTFFSSLIPEAPQGVAN
ncbi:hypothetical protein F2P81_006789 [Scophthalmus maximus]|uniref:Ubiquitin-like domain-containing protein n=1 Tax=Scophthalmus maximus TaxID=52904 RepID=A0A6A4TDE5_SCOMX|nr:hypothetical protein F2P81_006789 [Scophthalmus maximus]